MIVFTKGVLDGDDIVVTLREDVPLQETLADLQWQGADERLKEVCHRLGDEKLPGQVPRWRKSWPRDRKG
jgi:hypothetical protein